MEPSLDRHRILAARVVKLELVTAITWSLIDLQKAGRETIPESKLARSARELV